MINRTEYYGKIKYVLQELLPEKNFIMLPEGSKKNMSELLAYINKLVR